MKTTPITSCACRRGLNLRLMALLLFLLLSAGQSTAAAVNVLVDPGFEEGGGAWEFNTWGAGAGQLDTATVHSGLNSWKWNGEGAAPDAWQGGRQLSIPVNDTKFYRYSAYVNVPTANATANKFGWTFRHNVGAGGADLGYTLITAPGWTLVQGPILQPAPGVSSWGYVGFHTVSFGGQIPFYLDDLAVEELDALVLNGRVVNSQGAGVDGANVTAASADYATPATSTTGGGFYTLLVPAGTYTVAADIPGFKGSTVSTVSTNPTAASDIVLGADPDYDPDFILFARSTALPGAGAPWPTAFPAGGSLTPLGAPEVQFLGGVKWEQNVADGPGYRLGTYNDAIPVNGASVVVVARPKRAASDNWDSIVDVFYDRLVLGIRNDTGVVNVRCNGSLDYSAAAIPEGQVTVLSLVVQPTGEYKVWANGAEIMNNSVASDMTSLVPNVPGTYANAINVGRNNPDGWTTFNGNIGDVYLYKTALTETKRAALEASLLAKFITNATLRYTISASAGANGSISPSGSVAAVQGYDQTFTMTASAGYVLADVLVDGASVGPVASYTFTAVSADHTIAASFAAMPPQTITASAGPNGTISPLGAVTVPAGAGQAFAILPNSGYKIAQVLVDGVSVDPAGTYTFTHVIAPHTLAVTFAAISMNIPRTDQLYFSAVADDLPADTLPTGSWPSYVPSGRVMTVLGGTDITPSVEVVGGVKWQKNVATTAGPELNGYRVGNSIASPIPVTGSTIIIVAKPLRDTALTGPWDSLVDVFYDRLVLGIKNDTGEVIARVNGGVNTSTELIPDGQPTVLSLVVQPDGSWNVWANAALIMNGSAPPMTQWVPGGAAYQKYIDVGRNDPDGWTAFNGNIGDVFLYKTALTAAERTQVEAILMTKFKVPLPPAFKWAGPNNGNWSNPAHWNSQVPGAGQTATFSDTSSAGQTVQLDSDVTVAGLNFNNLVAGSTLASASGRTLILDNGSSRVGLLTEGGSHVVSANFDIPVGLNKLGEGTLTLSGSNVGFSAGGIGWNAAVPNDGGIRVTGPGSELVIAGTLTQVEQRGTLVTAGGRLTISGTYQTSGRDQIIGDAGGLGEVILRGQGSWTHTGTGVFVVGNDQPSCVGKLTLNDQAQLNLPDGQLNLAVGWAGGTTAIVEQNGGTVTTLADSDGWCGSGTFGSGVIMGNWTDDRCQATYSLNGGKLITSSIWNLAFDWEACRPDIAKRGSTAIFNFNGGVIQPNMPDSTRQTAIDDGMNHFMGNLSHAYVQAGGAIFDTAFENSLLQSLEHDPAGPALDGGLTKRGTGTLTLLKSSTYTGPTSVQAGVLACAVADALGGGPLDIGTGAKLQLDFAGTRTIAQLTFQGGPPRPAGSYGATGSGATTIDDAHFAGTGSVTVALPTPPTPDLPVSGIAVSEGVPSFTFPTVAGFKYRLVFKNALTDPAWLAVISPPTNPGPDGWTAPSNGASMVITDPSAVGQPHRFYRLEAATP